MKKVLHVSVNLLSRSYKKFSVLLLFIVVAFNINAQVNGDFRSIANGNWNDTLSWEMYNGSSWIAASWLPGDSANVNVTIQDSTTIHLRKTPAKAIANLSVGMGASGILDFDSINGSITVNGATVIAGGGQINITTTSAVVRTFTDLTIGSSAAWNNSTGNIAIKGNLTNNGTFTSGTGTYTLSGTAKTIFGTVSFSTLSIAGTYTNNDSLTVSTSLAGAGTLTQAGNAVLTLSGGITITGLNFTGNTPNMVIYNGAVAQTVKATAYYDVQINNLTGNVSLPAGTTTVNDTMTIFSGALLNIATGTLAITGVVVNNGTITASGASSTILFQGPVAQTLGSQITSNQIGNVIVNNAAGVTITPPVQINRGLTLTSGNLSSGGTITLGSGAANPFTYIRSNGNIATAFITNYGTGANNFTYSGTIASQTIGAELPAIAASLTINDSLGVTLNANLTVITLNLTKGVLASAPHLIAVTGTTVASITGGLANSYVTGSLSRAFPASVPNGTTYAFPVGKSAYQLFEVVNPVINTTGSITVEAFDANSGGTAGFGLATLNTNRYWTATPSTPNLLITTAIRLTEATLGTANTIGQAPVTNGIYINVGGTIAGQTVLSGPVAAGLGSFVLATGGTLNAGTYAVGDTSILPKLTNVAALLNSIIVGGNLIFEMQSNYNGTFGEVFPITFKQYTTTGGNWTVTIRPASGVTTRTTEGDPGSANSLIVFDGGDKITIDGRAGGAGSSIGWLFRNTRTAATVGPTFSFLDDAVNNTLAYLQVEGQNTIITSGTILFGTSTGTTGNDSNTISNCSIRDRSDVSGAPANAIYAHGTSGAENSSNTIANNNIFNFTTNGIYAAVTANTGGSGNWMISGNSFYSNAGPTTPQTAINLIQGLFPGNGNNIITGNYIGGSAPLCGGNPLTNYGTSNSTLTGINLTVDTATPSSVQNNIIQNIALKGGNTGSFTGISVISGSVNIGNVAGNIIGSATVANSIQVEGTGVSMGIYSSPATAAAVENIANNVIANIYSSSVSTSESNIGIFADAGLNNIVGNSIFNLTADNGNIAAGAAASLVGISLTSATAGQTISKNVIHSLINTHFTAAVKLVGINYSGAATGVNTISKNFIHNFSAITSSTTAQFTGINAVAGVATYSNNMISLGIDNTGASITETPVIVGIDKASNNNMNFYYNSVYIGGVNVGTGVVNTFAFRRTVSATGGDTLLNNIFMNARSNATTGGKHYAIYLNALAKLKSNYNDLYVYGAGTVVGDVATLDFNSFVVWQAVNLLDSNSVNDDPAFITPDGSSIATNLHINPSLPTIVESGAKPISIIDDIDSVGIRSGYPKSGQKPGGGIAPDIGADEGDFAKLVLAVNSSSANDLRFMVYPNPAQEKTNLIFNSENGGSFLIKLTDITGRECMTTQLYRAQKDDNLVEVDLNDFAKGIYMISLINENGTSHVEKLVIE